MSLGKISAVVLAVATTPAFASGKPVYDVVMKPLSNPYAAAMEQGVREGAKQAGVEYFLQAVANDQDTQAQGSVCETMLQKKPVAMIAAAIDANNLLACLKQANEMKIPVADLDDGFDPVLDKKAGVDIAFHIGADNEAAGAKAADYLAGALGKDAKGSVLVIAGATGNGQKRVRGFTNAMKSAAPGLVLIASPGEGKAAGVVSEALQRHPDLVAIFGADDEMALATVEAARAAGKDKVLVVGVDGAQEAVKSILAGRLNATVALLPYLAGLRAVETMKTSLAGEKPAEFTYLPTLLLTKAALEAKTDPLLQYLK